MPASRSRSCASSAQAVGRAGLGVFEKTRHRCADRCDSGRDGQAVLEEKGAHRVDDHRALRDESRTHPVERLEVLLGGVLTGTKRMVGRVIASAMASASRKSDLLPFT